MNDYQIHLETIEELRKAVRLCQINGELFHLLESNAVWLVRRSDKLGIRLPDRERILTLLHNAKRMIPEMSISPEVKRPDSPTDNEAEPLLGF